MHTRLVVGFACKGNIDYDEIWRCFNLWILAPGIEPELLNLKYN